MYEIWSLGHTPYEDFTNFEVSGRILASKMIKLCVPEHRHSSKSPDCLEHVPK